MYKVAFWVLFEISFVITLEPHVGHTKFADFYTLSYIIIHPSGKGVSLMLCSSFFSKFPATLTVGIFLENKFRLLI